MDDRGTRIIQDLDRKIWTELVLEREDFASFIINSTLDGLCSYDRDLRVTLWNPGMERITGIPKEDILGDSLFTRFAFLRDFGIQHYILDPLEGISARADDLPFHISENGRQGFVQGLCCPLRDEQQRIVGGLAVVREITERKIAEKEVRRLHRAKARLRFLGEAGMLLSGTLDYDAVLKAVMDLTTVHFEAWSKLRIVRADGSIQLVMSHQDPDLLEELTKLQPRFEPRADLKEGPIHILKNGGRHFVPDFPDPTLPIFKEQPEHLAALRAMGERSYICVPLTARGSIFGTFSLLSTGRRYTEEDLSTAEDLARWIALAIHNARLFERARG
jgi:PAS domain S-box-containing protein